MMVRRLRDGAYGWAFRMSVPFTFAGTWYAPNWWIAELHGCRDVIPADGVRAHYVPYNTSRHAATTARTARG